MNRKNSLWVMLTVLLTFAFVLSACQPAPTATPVVEEAAPEEVTITIAAGAVGEEFEAVVAAADRYMAANPNVTVEVLDTPDLATDRLGLYLQFFEAQSPEVDVYQIDVIWPGDLAEHLVDLYEYGAAEVVPEHFPAIIKNNTVDGKLLGIPWFTDAGLLYYRTDLLEKYGYTAPPTTWDELEEMAQTIMDGERAAGNEDFWGYVWQGNAYEGLTCDALEWIDSNGGGTIVSEDKKITINNAAAAEIVDQAAGWVGTISPSGVTGFGEEDARNMWQAGNSAFMRNWPYAYALGQGDDSAVKDVFDVTPLPAGASGHGSAALGGWQLAVSKYSENPEVAADVAFFLASADEQKIRAINISNNPTVMSLYQDAEILAASPFMGKLYDVFVNAAARPSTATAPQYNETSVLFFTAVHGVLTGEMDAQTAFEELEADLQDLLGFEVGQPEMVAAPVTEEEVTVTIAAGAVGEEFEAVVAAADRYMEANPNVTIEVLDTPDLATDRLGLYLQFFEAQSPEVDVYQIDVIWPGDLAEHLVDLYEYGAAEVVPEHFPAIIKNNTVDGKLLGIPWFTDAGLLYYRTDLLEKYGYTAPPTTWDELEEMAQTIMDGERAAGNEDFWGYVWQGNAYEGLTCDALEWIDSNGGGTIVSEDKKITINNAAAAEIVDQAAGWVGTISPSGVTGFGEEDARNMWQAGNSAFMRNWPYAYALGQGDDSAVKDVFDVTPLPAGASGHGSAALGGWQLAVSKYSENPEVAADVAFFLASADEQKIRAINISNNPTVMSLYQDAEILAASPFMGKLYDVFVNAAARPSTATAPKYNETSVLFFTAVHGVLTGEMDALTAFEELELDLQDLLGFEIGTP
jgi:trehalose/maltose transport system substrate-binding protein